MSINFPNLPAAMDAWCVRHGRNAAELARALKVSKATTTRWKQGEEPEVKRIKEVAKMLGVTVGYLADEEEMAHNDEELHILRGFRSGNSSTRSAMQAIAGISKDAPDGAKPT